MILILKKSSKIILSWFLSIMIFALQGSSVYADDYPEISAKSSVVIDSLTGEVLFSKNKDEKLPMASTTKIMTTLLTLEHGDLDTVFTVDSEAIKVEGSSMGLQENDKVTLRDLCYGMLLPSGNDAANSAAVRVGGTTEKFIDMMNRKAKELGMKSTHFVTPSGLDDYTDDHYSTAYDMAVLARAAMKNEEFRKICRCDKAKVKFGNPPYERWLKNTNKLLKNCEGVIGIKTGFTDKAKRCLVSACQRGGGELICVTLNAPNDWQDHKNLYDRSFSYLSEQTLKVKDADDLTLNVVGGDKDFVKCRTFEPKAVMIKGRAEKVRAVVKLPDFVYAPVKLGDKVGVAEYYYNDEKIMSSDIFAMDFANRKIPEEKSFWEKIKKKFQILA